MNFEEDFRLGFIFKYFAQLCMITQLYDDDNNIMIRDLDLS